MNDLISRSKLDKKLCEKKAMYTSVATKEAFDKTISIVWEMPDETGWISVDDRLPEIENETPYCSNCGARMDGDVNGIKRC